MTALAQKIQVAVHLSEHQRAKIFGVLAAVLILCMSFYVWSVHAAIMNVVSREAVIKDIHLKSSAVADLESNYFNLENKISLDLAHRNGFSEVPVSLLK